MNKIDKVINYFRSLREEVSGGPTMSVGTGKSSLGYNINTETPPVRKRKKYATGGRNSRKLWLQDLKNK